MFQDLIIELPEKTKIANVMYADAPLRLGGTPRNISLNDLYQKVSLHFTYSDALFSKQKHPPYLKQGSNQSNSKSNYLVKNFERLGFTDTSCFVICNMGQVGHGVFADKDFEPGECFILYAGIITGKGESKANSAYAFSYNKDLALSVDAAERGNISRFIQHMPLHFDLYTQHAQTLPNYDKKLPENSKEDDNFWEWRNIVCKAGLTENDIAWANLSMMLVPIQGVPCIVFYNTRKINKGDQLGISYGSGYWIRRKVKPKLFDLNGGIVPENRYGHKEVIISLPIIEFFNQLPQFQNIGVTKSYNALMFEKDLQRKQEALFPVWFSHLAEPVSIFELRELLLEYNAIEKEYASIENEFVQKLRDILPQDFKIKIYERDPHQRSTKPIYDLVCTTEDLMKWAQLTALVKSPTFATSNIATKCLKITQEVILMDIESTSKQLFLMNICTMAKIQGFFAKRLPEDYIPSGPARRDPTGIVMPTAEEAFSQILFYNPGLTRKDIDNAYELLFNPTKANVTHALSSMLISNDDTSLNTVTSSFFKNKTPATWKIYPSDKLSGKYIGHQVRFFNLPKEQSGQAGPFLNKLKQSGFEAELKGSSEKPSIVVDLTASKKL